MASKVGELTINLVAGTGQFKSDITSAQKHTEKAMGGMSNAVKGFAGLLGAGITASAFVGFVKNVVDAQDKLNDLSKVTGLSVEKLSGLGFAAKQSGSDLDGIAKSVSFLSKNIGQNGAEFRKLGITAKDPLEAFKQLSDIFVSIEDPQLRAAFAAKALGKSWENAAPLLAEGGKAIGLMVADGERLSNVTTASAKAADEFNDSLERMSAAAGGAGTSIANFFIPGLTKLFNAFGETKKTAQDLEIELSQLENNSKRSKGAGLLHSWMYGSKDDLNKKISDTKSQIEQLRIAAEAKPKTPSGDTSKAKAFVDDGSATKAAAQSAEESIKELQDSYKPFFAFKTKLQKEEEDSLEKSRKDWESANIKLQSDKDQSAMKDMQRINYLGDQQLAEIESRRQNLIDAGMNEDQIQAQFDTAKLNSAAITSHAMIELAKSTAAAQQAVLVGSLGTISSLMSSENETLFAIGKAAAIANTIISTQQGAAAALAYPLIGPALAAAVYAAGAANIATILGTNIGGGTRSSANQTFSGTSGGSRPSAKGGFDIPSGVNPLTQLHEKEMVLPQKLADSVRNMTGGGGAININDSRKIYIDGSADRASILKSVDNMIVEGNARLVDTLQRRRMI